MVSDKQVRKLRRLLLMGKSLTVAAARTDMDDKTARKYRRQGKLPCELARSHDWSTRVDPFAEVWAEVCAMLEEQSGLQAKTIFGELRRRYPSRFADGQLRTLQRKVRRWRATAGPAKEVFFSQVHEPGRLAASDFTHMNELGVTIAGQAFEHMVYHLVLTYSNWESMTICFSESFESLSEGLQNALWELGGVPQRHRTDRLSTAVNNLTEQKEFTQRYQGLLAHYGLVGEKIQAGHGNENGDIEQRHRRFKEAVEQALLLRGSRDFASREEYNRFLHELKEQLNAGLRHRLADELAVLRPLPTRRLEACQRRRCRVDQGSLIHVERNSYSVPSRLIGEEVEARLYAEHVEVWYAQKLVERLPRLRGRDKQRVSYRHVIDWLVRKPGAFAQYRHRQELFPSSVFRIAYDTLISQDAATADKEYLHLLHLAAQESEAAVEATLRCCLTAGQPITAVAVAIVVKQQAAPAVPEVMIDAVDLSVFDDLLTEEEDDHESGREGEIGTAVTGSAPADVPDELRGTGPAGPAGDLQLRAFPAGVVRAGVPAAADQTHQPLSPAIPAAAGEKLGDVRLETAADEGGPAGAEPARRELRGTPREPVGFRQSRFGEDAFAVWSGPGTGPSGSAGVVHDIHSAGAGTAGGQARFEAEGRAETTGRLRGAADRRPRLRAAEPGRDGGVVHAYGRALRTRQHLVDQQSAVLEVGEHLQGSDDDGGGYRSARAPQCDPGTESAELSTGAGQKGQRRPGSERAEKGGGINSRRFDEEPMAGPGYAPLPVAALQVAALRQAPPSRTRPAFRLGANGTRSSKQTRTGIRIVAEAKG
jgi:Mu transposase-like protein